MEKKSPGVTDALAEAVANYATEFAPYFSKGSVTRAIADKDPSVIAKNAILPRSNSGKEVDTINRTLELIGDNKPLQKQVAHAHLNGLIDEASRGKDFRETFIKGWERYTNPSGNNNAVLRKAYGKEYDSVNSLVNQFKSSKPKDFDDVAESLISGINKRETANQLGIKEALREEAAVTRGATQEAKETIKFANKARDLDIKLAKKKIEDDVRSFVGDRAVYVDGKIVPKGNYSGGKFIGQLYMTEAALQAATGAGGALAKATMGGGLILSRVALNKFLASERGIGLLKAAIRNTPGTTQAAATARIIQNFLREGEEE
jgi:hypothetical protein